jgi:hypothetical protein
MKFIFVTERFDSVDVNQSLLRPIDTVEPTRVDLGEHLEVLTLPVGELRYFLRLEVLYRLYTPVREVRRGLSTALLT